MTYDPNNIFAKILRKEIPCHKIFESEHTLAFTDIAPLAKIHIIVIPKRAYIDLIDFIDHAPLEEKMDFFDSVSSIAKDQNLTEHGFRSVANRGEYGRQEVPHFHLHLLGGEKIASLRGAE